MATRFRCMIGIHGAPAHFRKVRGFMVGNCPHCWADLFSLDAMVWSRLPDNSIGLFGRR